MIPHQPNGRMLDDFIRVAGLSPEKVNRHVDRYGSVGACSLPLGLDELFQAGRIKSGDRVMPVGVGGGTSYGGMIYQV